MQHALINQQWLALVAAEGFVPHSKEARRLRNCPALRTVRNFDFHTSAERVLAIGCPSRDMRGENHPACPAISDLWAEHAQFSKLIYPILPSDALRLFSRVYRCNCGGRNYCTDESLSFFLSPHAPIVQLHLSTGYAFASKWLSSVFLFVIVTQNELDSN